MVKKEKGALALEATIAFTVFICFLFMLIAIAKLSMVYITINDITSETAKRIAGMSYPISFVNDMYDELGNKVETSTDVEQASFKIMSEVNKSSNSTNSIVQSLGLNIGNTVLDKTGIQNLLNNAKNLVIDTVFTNLETFVNEKEVELVSNIYVDLIEKTEMPIDVDNINVVCFSLPLPETTFKRQNQSMAAKLGVDADDLCKDDVILCVEYDYKIVVPFFPSYDVKLKSTAVEKAWVHGGNHVTPSKREGVDVTGLLGKENVYITNSGNGKKYHKGDCFTLRRSGSNLTSLPRNQAIARGFKPCAVCRPDSKDD